MRISLFGKRKETLEGKKFTQYSTKIERRDGTTQYTIVKFKEGTPEPKYSDLPLNIIVPKDKASMAKKAWISEDGTKQGINFTLWVSEWELDPNTYKDTSLDEFMD